MTYEEPDAPSVLVRSDLRPSTFRVFEAEAKRRSTTVGQLLSMLADRAVRTPRKARGHVIDERIAELNAQGLSDNRIAKRLGVAQSTVSRRRQALGLETPTPRALGSGRKARSAEAKS